MLLQLFLYGYIIYNIIGILDDRATERSIGSKDIYHYDL